MKNLVRGAAIVSLLSLCVVFIYAQATTDHTLTIANDSQPKIENKVDNNLSYNQQDKNKKLVKTTAIVKSSNAGARCHASVPIPKLFAGVETFKIRQAEFALSYLLLARGSSRWLRGSSACWISLTCACR